MFIKWLKDVGIKNISLVGGKNASLGEMIQNLTAKGINIPNGFVVTTNAYSEFLQFNGINKKIKLIVDSIDINDLVNLRRNGMKIRMLFQNCEFPPKIENDIFKFYKELSQKYIDSNGEIQMATDVAVRSSSTAEDLQDASFAGQQETYLNVRGKYQVIDSIKNCFASLFTDRAIFYRKTVKYEDYGNLKISVCVQKMVRSDLGSAGVAFSLDPETGNNNTIIINGAWGLGELVVQGGVKPDEIIVFKPTLNKYDSIIDKKIGDKQVKIVYGTNPENKIKTIPVSKNRYNKFCISDSDIIKLSKWVVEIENYYSDMYNKYSPVDIEWAIDGISKELFIVQARPETVHSNKKHDVITEYEIDKKPDTVPIMTGIAVGNKISTGKVKIIHSLDNRNMDDDGIDFNEGDILVTDITDPDWEPIMVKASAIVTNKGGRTCFSGDTVILTNKGFKTFEEIHENYEDLQVPSLNRSTLKMEWKPIENSMKKNDSLIKISCSNTGHNSENTLKITADHKMINLQNGTLVDTEIGDMLDNDEYIVLAEKVPQIGDNTNDLTDYYYNIGKNYNNEDIIEELFCEEKENSYAFLAGVADNNEYNECRLWITSGTTELTQTIVVACMRVGIVPRVSSATYNNIIIEEDIDKINVYTKIIDCSEMANIETKFYNCKQLFDQTIVTDLSYIYTNKLIGENKVGEILDEIDDNDVTDSTNSIINSDIRQTKVIKVEDLEEQEVYNITVADHHNYIVFTKNYTSILVNNCHAAIIARELGINAVVGTGNCTDVLKYDQNITVSCAEGEIGNIYEGAINFKETYIDIQKLPQIKTNIMLNIASPNNVFKYYNYPIKGVGLVREEFIINNFIKVHPLALINYDKLDDKVKTEVDKLTVGYSTPKEYYVNKLTYGLGRIAAAFYPHDVIIRFSDFKSNEYRNLLGGDMFEPHEENPMIGWRGGSRYYSEKFKEAFGLECLAIKKIREQLGLKNVIVMIPFCRTIEECKEVQKVMKEYGLERGKEGLKIYIMCEVPSNVILAEQFCKLVDGFSIGSNDLTQLTLGLDRDSELVSHIYNERNDSVKWMISKAIRTCKKNGTKIGICGQGPSDYPDFAQFLVQEGIDSISITPDSIVRTINAIHNIEKN